MNIDKISCFAFDFDNTLVSSMDVSVQRHKTFSRIYGLPIADDETLRFAVASGHKPIDIFELCHPGSVDCYEQYLTWKRTNIASYRVSAFPRVTIMLKKLRELNRHIAVVSQRDGGLLELVDVLGVKSEEFIWLQDASENPYLKPDPGFFGGLLQKCRELEIAKDEILYIDDSILGYYAALGAGINFIGVITGVTTSIQFKNAGAEVLNGVQDVLELIEGVQ